MKILVSNFMWLKSNATVFFVRYAVEAGVI